MDSPFRTPLPRHDGESDIFGYFAFLLEGGKDAGTGWRVVWCGE